MGVWAGGVRNLNCPNNKNQEGRGKYRTVWQVKKSTTKGGKCAAVFYERKYNHHGHREKEGCKSEEQRWCVRTHHPVQERSVCVCVCGVEGVGCVCGVCAR